MSAMTKVFKVIRLLIMVMLIINMTSVGAIISVPQAQAVAEVDVWPDCGWDNCTANDFSVNSVWLGDCSTGAPIAGTCTPGDIVSTCIWSELENNTGAERNAITLTADIYIDGIYSNDLASCGIESVPGNNVQSGNFYAINWVCGSEVELENIVVGWSTKNNATCADPKCSNYNPAQCGAETSIFVAAPLVSDFTYSPACLGEDVNFTENTSGGVAPYTYSWDFGDSNISTAQNPTHTYTNPGIYSVTLTVTDFDNNTDSQSYNVEVFSNPVADFSATPLSGLSPLEVDFTDESITGSGAINTWLWNFDYGTSEINTSVFQNGNFTYNSNGSYSISLTVTDENGCSDTLIKNNYITVSECNIDSDCNDELYCNGAETCVSGECQSGVVVSCSGNNIDAVDSCTNDPDNNPLTIDFRSMFASQCIEETDSCSTGDDTVVSTCSVAECNAECDDSNPCTDTICADQSGCVGVDQYIYEDVPNSCNGDCSCQQNVCGAPTIIQGACGDCVTDEDCNNLDMDYCAGSEIIHNEGVCSNFTCTIATTTVSDCDNNLACDGVETCEAAQCVAGTAIDCSNYDISGVSECAFSPDNNPYTWDSRNAFSSTCQEPTGECNRGDTTVASACSSECGGCTADVDCDDDNSVTTDTCNLDTCGCTNVDNSTCGNETINEGESCDDGNKANGDGCNSSCQWETQTFVCAEKPTSTVWNTVGQYQQTCASSDGENCLSWLPVADEITDFSATSSVDSCQFICSEGFSWDGEMCKADPFCGDDVCNVNESCSNCSSDCGSCQRSSGGGGGGSLPTDLQISNPQLSMQCQSGVLMITTSWTTNKTASTRIVYGDNSVPNPSLTFGPNYGYSASTIQDTAMITGHSVSFIGYAQGVPFYFRPVSTNVIEVIGAEKGIDQTLICDGGNTDSEVIVLGEEGEPALEITKIVSTEFTSPGAKNIKYTVTITNFGNLDAFDVELIDVLPVGLVYSDSGLQERNWNFDSIMAGEEKIVEYIVDVSDTAEAKIYTNTATVSASNFATISASADLDVRKVEVLAATGINMKEFFYLMGFMLSMFGASQYMRRKSS